MRTTPILAIDTATPSPAVTLLAGERAFDEPLPPERHASERLLSSIEACLDRAGVPLSECVIAVCAGPGSFTGVRVGLATAWGLARAAGCAVEAVSTLAAMAEAARRPGLLRVATALDAGRGEVAWQAFDVSGPRARALTAATRARREEVEAAAGGFSFGTLPPDLLGSLPGVVPISGLVSKALAAAVARSSSAGPWKVGEAIYARPSAAEEKRGAP